MYADTQTAVVTGAIAEAVGAAAQRIETLILTAKASRSARDIKRVVEIPASAVGRVIGVHGAVIRHISEVCLRSPLRASYT